MVTRAARRAPAAPLVTYTDGSRGMYTAFGYKSVRTATREGRTPTAAAATQHERWDREKLQAQSREFRRDNGIYSGMIRRARSYIVGTGFKLQALTKSRRWNAQAEAAWSEWWRRPDISGLLSGSRCEALVADELLTCGEVGVLLADGQRIQIVEAEQIKGPGQTDPGITRSDTGVVTGYRVCPYGTGGAVDLARGTNYSPERFLYVASTERPSSLRAVPPCQAAFAMLHRINDVCDSEAIAWQLESRIALIVNRATGMPMPSAVASEDDTISDADAEGNPAGKWVTELDYATIFHGDTGDTVSGMDRKAARNLNETLIPFFRLLGLPLGLPLEILLLDWTRSNYSQSRAVLEQAHVSFLEWQTLLEDYFYRPLYQWWLTQAIEAGTLTDRADATAHEWLRPSPPWIDQLAEAQAWGERIDRGLTTYSTACKSQNTDREAVLAQRQREIVEAIEAAQAIEKETGVAVPWQPLAGMKAAPPAPSAVAVPEEPEAEAEGEPPAPSEGDELDEGDAEPADEEAEPEPEPEPEEAPA